MQRLASATQYKPGTGILKRTRPAAVGPRKPSGRWLLAVECINTRTLAIYFTFFQMDVLNG